MLPSQTVLEKKRHAQMIWIIYQPRRKRKRSGDSDDEGSGSESDSDSDSDSNSYCSNKSAKNKDLEDKDDDEEEGEGLAFSWLCPSLLFIIAVSECNGLHFMKHICDVVLHTPEMIVLLASSLLILQFKYQYTSTGLLTFRVS